MGYKAFKGDVAAAALSDPEKHISGIKRGEDDEEFVFTYSHDVLNSPIELKAMATDVLSYPDGNDFMIFTADDHLPIIIKLAIEKVGARTFGKTAHQVIVQVARTITTALENEAVVIDDGPLPGLSADADDSDVSDYETEYYEYEDEDFGMHTKSATRASTPLSFRSLNREARFRLYRDLRTSLRAGVHPYLLGETRLSSGSIIALSFPVTGLGIPSDTLEAWDLESTDYIVLLMRLQGTYPSLQTFLDCQDEDGSIQFRLGRCQSPEPSLETARSAFSDNRDGREKQERETEGSGAAPSRHAADDFRLMYLFSPINELLEKHLPKLLRLRREQNLSWDQAVEAMSGSENGSVRGQASSSAIDASPCQRPHKKDPVINSSVSQRLQQDFAISEAQDASLPLVAMQFSLRRLARCTEFCMVCHCRISGSYEAVKPYVCEGDLCIYQYVVLGFGRSLEHEIINHPYVVDLLISLFVTSVNGKSYRKRDLPKALAVKAPRQGTADEPNTPILAWADFSTRHLWFTYEDEPRAQTFVPGSRFLITPITPAKSAPFMSVLDCHGFDRHICQVIGKEEDKKLYSVICRLNPTDAGSHPDVEAIPDIETGVAGWRKVAVWLFDTDIDDMNEQQRDVATVAVANSIPSVLDMRSYLLEKPGRRLEHWPRMDKSSRTLLNWIITSNRSYLVQDGPVPTRPPGIVGPSIPVHPLTEARKVTGLQDDWMQFRFQQGSPYKEHKFEQAVKTLQAMDPTRNPATLYAWHGSQLGRWHNIIRQGLDFTDVLNGRAQGNGVYFSSDFNVSVGYCRVSLRSQTWQSSVLFPTAAISICEIVNDPGRFVSSNPHIVVKQTEWIQCRYLLVKVDPSSAARSEPLPNPLRLVANGYEEQDISRVLRNGLDTVNIPKIVSAIAPKKRKSNSGGRSRPLRGRSQGSADEQEISMALQFCGISSDSDTGTSSSGASKRRRGSSASSSKRQTKRRSPRTWAESREETPLIPVTSGVTPVTSFTPGTLDPESLPVMPEPSWVTSSPGALRKLNQEIRDMQKLQSETPLSALGWYIDFEKMNNIFQWIVELHSFPQDLLLAQDMMSLNCQSIVLEIRFGSTYPMAPPFVRVVRPTFVPFRLGGGGHVTEGGAICSELLTNSGWLPILSLEKVLLSVRLGLSDDERPARLEMSQSASQSSYSIGAAVAAYERAARAHGWQLPEGFRNVMTM